jgi:tetratricopeptide (TPR) repeat protein
MAASSDKKIAEGLEHLRQAAKCMKTSFLKWNPDLDGAVSEYQKAAVAFKNAKAYDQATNAYIKASDVQRENGSDFHAAKSLEAASLIYKEMGELDKACHMVETAANLYREHGTPDTAVIALEKAGKMVEKDHPERAIHLYKKAMDAAEMEDRPRQCAELIGKAARVYIRHRRLDEAAEALKQEIEWYSQVESHGMINKLVMGLVMVHLHRGDYVAADQAFKSCLGYPGFAESEEASGIQQVLDAYDEGDQAAADQALRSPLFRYMENDFTKLARDLVVPGGGTGARGEDMGGGDDYEEGLL